MKNKITSFILIAALALLTGLAGTGNMGNAAAETNDHIDVCFMDSDLAEF